MATRLLVALAAAIALLGGGYWWGHTATENAWQVRQAKADQKVRAAMAKEAERADQAASHYLQEHLDQESRYAELHLVHEELRRRAPLVVRVPVVVDASDCPAVAGSEQAPGPVAGDAEPGQRLTLAAVRMWNGALAGADVPAGSCGAAGAAAGADAADDEACADDAGLTLDDAWDNHALNARACAQDRQRYRALIDYLNKQTPSGD